MVFRNIFNRIRKRADQQNQKGAVVIEGLLSLTIFMFFIFTLLFLIEIAYTQSRMSVALCGATKQVAQYAHLYYATSINESMTGSGGKSSEIFNEVGDFITEIGSSLGDISSDIGDLVTGAGDAMKGDNIADYLKSAAGEALVQKLMETNLKTGGASSAQEFYKMHNVSDVNMMESKVLEGTSRDLFMGISYKIKITRFFNEDIGSFRITNWAYTTVWGSASDSGGSGDAGGSGGAGGE